MSKKGTIYFFTGLAGAGKTTLGELFYKKLKSKKPNVVWLDGDELRPILHANLGYSDAERRQGSYRTFKLCKMLADQGIDVVCCFICMYDEIRDWNRKNIDNYKEIYVKVKMETLVRRDKKGLYSHGKNVVGVDLPFEEPKTPDLVVENDGLCTPENIVSQITERFWGDKK